MSAARPPRGWVRLAVVEAIQLPALGLVMARDAPACWWCAALWGSMACCAGTDSSWRWRNYLLVAQAVVWLIAASLFGARVR